MGRMGAPQRSLRTIHVGGTKGKGSVASLLFTALHSQGLRCGCYGSPHVERVTERVRLAGQEVEDEFLARGLAAALEAREAAEQEGTPGAAATWFDLFTAGAFWVFREAQVEWAVIEVGLGGRLDSTNVIQPDLCVLTHIDLEHTALLGNTRAAIAGEKAGILKPGAAFACGVQHYEGDDPLAVVGARAQELGLTMAQAENADSISGRNRALARTALQLLSERQGMADLDPAVLTQPEVLAAARLPGRLEFCRLGRVWVVLDGAHVPSSLRAVLGQRRADSRLQGPCRAVVAMGREKDAQGMFKELLGSADRAFSCSVEGALHRSGSDLAALAAQVGLESEAAPSARAALQQAVDSVGEGGWVLVTGSLYLIGELRGLLETQVPPEDD